MIIQDIHAVLCIHLKQEDLTPFDVSTISTVSLVLRKPDTKTTVTKEADIFAPLEGKCRVHLTPGDLSESGMYEYQLHITFSDLTTTRSPIQAFYVSDAIIPIAAEEGDLN